MPGNVLYARKLSAYLESISNLAQEKINWNSWRKIGDLANTANECKKFVTPGALILKPKAMTVKVTYYQ
ncbi:hypothetical protein VA249_13910 [Vibrio alfacsensis]|uniref:hypothetical protein n=1 Tax=Vibrio alfacsensis TaxID=1074311 RepID=UPI001BEE03FF|nr:hypothetical protein [Vibrio alfacsensis]BBM64745.1 hypothetical protein VA249_13910 [Vibrio alfacsensis]